MSRKLLASAIVALCTTVPAHAKTNSQGVIWEFESYRPSANTLYLFEKVDEYSELYPSMPNDSALQSALSRFYDNGQSPSDELLALIKDGNLYLQINDKEYSFKRTARRVVRGEGSGPTTYSSCNYPLSDDEITETYTNTSAHLTLVVTTLVVKYYPMTYSKVHQGFRELKLPDECSKTQRFNTFHKGYADLYRDGVKTASITIIRQDLKHAPNIEQ